MSTATPTVPGVARPAAALVRGGFSFAADGSHAVSLGYREDGRLDVESWSLTGAEPAWRAVPTARPVPAGSQVASCADGRVLLVHRDGDRIRLALLTPAATGPAGAAERLGAADERSLGTLDSPAVRLIPSPRPDTVAYATTVTDRDTTLWRITADGVHEIAVLPGRIGGAAWLGPHPLRLGITHHTTDGIRPAALDLSEPAQVEPLPVAGHQPAHLLLANPATGIVLYASGPPGRLRLAWAARHGLGPTHPADRLNQVPGRVVPLALAPDGPRVAVAVTGRARSALLVHDLAADRSDPVELPSAGRLGAVGGWTATALNVPFSAPASPPGLLTVPTAGTGHRARFRTPAAGPRPWSDARLERFAGPAGEIEAVVYGDPAGPAPALLALHGGPESAWDLGFDPLAQYLHAAGFTIVAPNQRGSVGYGTRHRRAIQDAWGGPDLADVIAVAEQVRAAQPPGTPPPALYGVSYGAFLAVLAAACRPGLWHRCVAVAPFLSGRRLHAEASAPVRRMIDRLGGATEWADEHGPRDLTRLHPRRVPLLLVHGSADEVIPVEQSRTLHRLMRRAGAPVTYLELPGVGHDPFFGRHADALRGTVAAFLREGTESPTPIPAVVPATTPERR
ncbi:alpha/beta hydrolase family protein [Micromonospora eburnea]|uniref:Dipeptidyl aminopeptidase/acylaminoacyl peptidase n=1 Tax=Micromonospora eburnea TaxID=227316 RepID=A0A1C6UWU8_9ACTN|nr:alpha/beta fold hydrolase [Micromonospora eburnea]SCL58446.1 Dipeptidyl aminopeptidase/acylaminoacyl peptidase [Micromonospora eburnea]